MSGASLKGIPHCRRIDCLWCTHGVLRSRPCIPTSVILWQLVSHSYSQYCFQCQVTTRRDSSQASRTILPIGKKRNRLRDRCGRRDNTVAGRTLAACTALRAILVIARLCPLCCRTVIHYDTCQRRHTHAQQNDTVISARHLVFYFRPPPTTCLATSQLLGYALPYVATWQNPYRVFVGREVWVAVPLSVASSV